METTSLITSTARRPKASCPGRSKVDGPYMITIPKIGIYGPSEQFWNHTRNASSFNECFVRLVLIRCDDYLT